MTTMSWPRSPVYLLEPVRVVGLWAIVFFAGRLFFGQLIEIRALSAPRASLKSSLGAKQERATKRWFYVTLLVGSVSLALSADGWWIFARYPQNKDIWRVVEMGSISFVSTLFLLYAFQLAWSIGQNYRRFSVVVAALLSLHFVLAGDRGGLIFWFVAVLAVIYLQGDRRLRRRLLVLSALGVIPLFLFLQQISIWRSWGIASESLGFASYIQEIDLLPQSFAHLVHGFEVVSFHGPQFDYMLDFFVVFFVQIIPSGVLAMFDWKFYHGAWQLAEYVRHGGGFFVPAEMYFVGGYSGVVLISCYFAVVAVIVDRLLVRVLAFGASAFRDPSVIAAALATASLPYTFFYGLQSFNRMMTLPVLLLVAVRLFQSPKPRRHSRGYHGRFGGSEL
jgi:hypothetical protein